MLALTSESDCAASRKGMERQKIASRATCRHRHRVDISESSDYLIVPTVRRLARAITYWPDSVSTMLQKSSKPIAENGYAVCDAARERKVSKEIRCPSVRTVINPSRSVRKMVARCPAS